MPSPSVARFGNIRQNRFEPSIIYLSTMIRLWTLAVATVAVVGFVQLACTSVPLTSPTGSTISITSDRDVLPLNGHATLQAVVIEVSGTPVQNGTVVNFTTTLGQIDPPEARTVNGVATASFNAGSISGTTVIHAFSGGAKTGSGNSSGGGVSIKIGAAAAGGISLSATPPSVSQSGGTVTISAFVTDPAGNPLPGVNVTFTSSTGSLAATSAISDSNGVARTTLTTTTTATVTAFAGSAKADVQVTVSIAPSVNIDVSPASPTEGSAASFTFTPTGGSGNNSPRQIATLRVDFGDGQSQTFTNITGSVGTTHAYSSAGGYTVTATTIDVNGNTGITSKAIVVQAATLPTVTVTATPNPIPADQNGLASLSVTATASGAPLRNVTLRLGTGDVLYSGTGNGSVAFRFTRPGSYTVIGSATDANGNTGTTSIVVVAQ